MKPTLNGKGRPSSGSTSPLPTLNREAVGKIALPGLSVAHTPSPSGVDKAEDRIPLSPVPVEEPAQEKLQERNSGERRSGVDKPRPRRPSIPHKPSRIPSTGNRATVMDVAQVWSQHEKQDSQDVESPRSTSPNTPLEFRPVQPAGTQAGLYHRKEGECERENQEPEEPPKVGTKPSIAGWGIQTSTTVSSTVGAPKVSESEKGGSLKLPEVLSPTEKRSSSWEKYSEFIMPALEEEWTPVPSPMPTLKGLLDVAVPIPETERVGESKVDYLPVDLLSTTLDPGRKAIKVAPNDLVTFGRRLNALVRFCAHALLKTFRVMLFRRSMSDLS